MSISTILYSFLAVYFLLTFTLYILSWTLAPQHARLPSFFARVLASVAAVVVASAYGFFVSLALRCVGYAGLSQWAAGRCFKWGMYIGTGVWFDVVEGKEHLKGTRPAVFLGNHQS